MMAVNMKSRFIRLFKCFAGKDTKNWLIVNDKWELFCIFVANCISMSDDFKEIKGGDVIDLGGKTLEVYDLPGHTAGEIVLLLKGSII
jgi:glyoxylase-like metal-dependent hydrolase (beta-lactamase superfamily II)